MKPSRAKAVDARVLLSDGGKKQPLSRFWKKQTIVLVFLRHFG